MPSSVIIKGEHGNIVGDLTPGGAQVVSSGASAVGPLTEGLSYISGQTVIDLADDASIEVLLITPSAPKNVLLAIGWSIGGDSLGFLFEDTVVSANGTTLGSANRNRQSSNTSSVQLFTTPTITGDGTQLASRFIAGGTGKSNSAGGFAAEADFLLKTGTNYLIRLTNVSGAVQPMTLGLSWIEEEEPA